MRRPRAREKFRRGARGSRLMIRNRNRFTPPTAKRPDPSAFGRDWRRAREPTIMASTGHERSAMQQFRWIALANRSTSRTRYSTALTPPPGPMRRRSGCVLASPWWSRRLYYRRRRRLANLVGRICAGWRFRRRPTAGIAPPPSAGPDRNRQDRLRRGGTACFWPSAPRADRCFRFRGAGAGRRSAACCAIRAVRRQEPRTEG